MDGDRFDRLIRSLSGSRRSLLSGILAMAGVWLGVPDAGARKKGNKSKNKKRKRPKKPRGGGGGCIPQCGSDKPCGGDGCGGTCGVCQPSEPHCIATRCQCTSGNTCPNPPVAAVCTVRACANGDCTMVDSPDGMPGPNCDGPQEVCQSGACICIPNCAGGTTCGDDGCGGACVCADSAFCQAGTCVPCDPPCSPGQRCVHGTCTCNPLNNACPIDQTLPPGMPNLPCGCFTFAGDDGGTACTDANSACDMSKPCDSNDDCPVRGVCLLGCASSGNPNRCSRPSN